LEKIKDGTDTMIC